MTRVKAPPGVASADVVFDVSAGRRGVVMSDGHRAILIEFRPKIIKDEEPHDGRQTNVA